MLGPVLGSMIYGAVGFMYTFIIFAVLISFGAIAVMKFLPNSLNHTYHALDDSGNSDLADGAE
jgi:hypothetical protein